jgi:hypothetical protein
MFEHYNLMDLIETRGYIILRFIFKKVTLRSYGCFLMLT